MLLLDDSGASISAYMYAWMYG